MRAAAGTLLISMVLLTAGCGAAEDVCQAAAAHVATCTGDHSLADRPVCASAAAEQEAEALLGRDCSSLLGQQVAAGKADSHDPFEPQCSASQKAACDATCPATAHNIVLGVTTYLWFSTCTPRDTLVLGTRYDHSCSCSYFILRPPW